MTLRESPPGEQASEAAPVAKKTAAKKATAKKAPAKKAPAKKATAKKAPAKKTAAKKAAPTAKKQLARSTTRRVVEPDSSAPAGNAGTPVAAPAPPAKPKPSPPPKPKPSPPAKKAEPPRPAPEDGHTGTPDAAPAEPKRKRWRLPALPRRRKPDAAAVAAAERAEARAAASGAAAAQAFDALYDRTAPDLTRQIYLLTGHHGISRQAVEHAFHTAWEHWPEVARDRDPQSWLRAEASEFALAPWRRWGPGQHRKADGRERFGSQQDREFFEAVLKLPQSYRKTLLLYDGLGLDLPETAAETEASTPATAGRLTHARAALSESVPELRKLPPAGQSELLHDRLERFAQAQPVRILPLGAVRHRSERRTEAWSRRTAGVLALIAVGVIYTTVTTEDYFAQIDKATAPVISNWSADDESAFSRELPIVHRPQAR